jgi:ATP-binding protein involved in chromosome partitioning
VPIAGVVENMSHFVCPHCGESTEIFGHGGGERVAEKYGFPLLGRIPIDVRIRVGGDEGNPIVIAEPDSPLAAAFRDTARQIAARVSTLALDRAQAEKKATAVPLQFFTKAPK